MKKCLMSIMIIILLFVTSCSSNTLKYDEWKDTILALGDGTYQILHQQEDSENIEMLTNCKHNQCVLTKIDCYIAEQEFAYFIGNYDGKKVYCKLNIATNELLYYAEENDEEFVMVYLNDMLNDGQIKLLSSFDDYSETDKIKFAEMKNTNN